MKCKQKIVLVGIFRILLIVILIFSYFIFRSPWKFREDRPIKILVLNSFDSQYFWVEEQVDAFFEVFQNENIPVEYQIIDLGFVGLETTIKESKIQTVLSFINDYNPDLIYSIGEDSQIYFGKIFEDSDTPWVFSWIVNPEKYVGAKNVAGVSPVLPLSKYYESWIDLFPGLKNVVVIYEDTEEARKFIEMVKSVKAEESLGFIFSNISFISTFEEFKFKVLESQNADLIVVSYLESLKNDSGDFVPRLEVVEWLISHSNVPEYSQEKALIKDGLLFSFNPSAYGQGKVAGDVAFNILVNGQSPLEIGMIIPEFGERSINLKRARMLGLDIPSSILINSAVYENFSWEGR